MENQIKVELNRLFGIFKGINAKIRRNEKAGDASACRVFGTFEECEAKFEQERAEALMFLKREQQIIQ